MGRLGSAGQPRSPSEPLSNRARRPSELQRRAWAAWVSQSTALCSPSEALSNRHVKLARPAAFWRAGPRLVTLCTGWGGAALSSWWVYTRTPRWKTAPLRPGPTRPPARPSSPASARLSAGRPPASASLGHLADMFWLAGDYRPLFSTQAGSTRRCRAGRQGLPLPRLDEELRRLCPCLSSARVIAQCRLDPCALSRAFRAG